MYRQIGMSNHMEMAEALLGNSHRLGAAPVHLALSPFHLPPPSRYAERAPCTLTPSLASSAGPLPNVGAVAGF